MAEPQERHGAGYEMYAACRNAAAEYSLAQFQHREHLATSPVH